jgi:hypothetical protein
VSRPPNLYFLKKFFHINLNLYIPCRFL